VATPFANGYENAQELDDEIVLAGLDGTKDEKLTGLALHLVIPDHIGAPKKNQPDLLAESEQVSAPKEPQGRQKAKGDASSKPKATSVKASTKKEMAKKRAA
jgi:hypothetical protein